MKPKKNIRLAYKVLVSIGVLLLPLIYIVGFEVMVYDENDKHLGKNFVFDEPMVHISNIPDHLAGDHISEKYGSMILSKLEWESHDSEYVNNINVDEVPCGELFTVIGAFREQRYGVLIKAFGPASSYFLVESNKYKQTVIERGSYDSHAHEYSNSFTGAGFTGTE
jgi:hypothetical protein